MRRDGIFDVCVSEGEKYPVGRTRREARKREKENDRVRDGIKSVKLAVNRIDFTGTVIPDMNTCPRFDDGPLLLHVSPRKKKIEAINYR